MRKQGACAAVWLLCLSALVAPSAQAKGKSTKPSAPTISAISSSSPKKGKVNVKVTIVLPKSNGNSSLTESRVTAGGKTCTIPKNKNSCTIKSINNGKELTVVAISKNKNGFGSANSKVTYVAGARPYTFVPPVAVVSPPVAVVSPPVAVVFPPVAVVSPPVAVVFPPAPTPSHTISSREFVGQNLSGQNFTNADLSGANFTNADLSGANFTNADLSGANFTNAKICHADFSGANLSMSTMVSTTVARQGGCTYPSVNFLNASLTSVSANSVNLEGANFTNSNLTNAAFVGGNLESAVLTGSNLSGVEISTPFLTNLKSGAITGLPRTLYSESGYSWKLVGGYLMGPRADLSNASLANLNLSGVSLQGANLYRVSSGGIANAPESLPTNWITFGGYLVGPGADLRFARLSGLNSQGADLTQADFTGADLSGAILTWGNARPNMRGTNFTNSNLSNARAANNDIRDANLSGADMTGLYAPNVNLDNSNMTDANLTNAHLSDVQFTNSNLTNAAFVGSNLQNANFTGATLAGVRSGSITFNSGAPDLPSDWKLASGYLVGPEANLSNAILNGADLNQVNLSGADLSGTQMAGTDLSGANLTGTDLSGANLTGTTSSEILGIPASLPVGWMLSYGSLIQVFSVSYDSNGGSDVIAGSFTTGDSIVSAPTPPTKDGYRFVGWATANGGSPISFPYSPTATHDITLYAIWSVSNPTFATPTLYSNGYTVQISNYDNTYTYTGSATASGVVSISNTGLVTVTEIAPKVSSTVTVTASREGNVVGSASKTATAACNPCAVGDSGPGGGIIFYVSQGFSCPSEGVCHYLEVAPSGWNSGPEPIKIWSRETALVYGNTCSHVVLATPGDRCNYGGLGQGYGESETAIGWVGSDTAAGLARSYSGGNKNDWYLPSLTELNRLCMWNVGQGPGDYYGDSNNGLCTGGMLNNPRYGAGNAGLVGGAYWSSTQNSRSTAWWKSINNGGAHGWNNKVNARYVRPVRAFRATELTAALIPTFGTPNPTANGFTVQITNYDNLFTYGGTATASGSVTVSGSGLVTVTDVAADNSSVLTITTTRAGYVSGSATLTWLRAALVPTFGTVNPTEDGFTVQITNYDNLFTYGGTATASGSVTVSGSGLVTVTGVAANSSSVATITTTRAGYVSGTATTTWLRAALVPIFGTPNPTANGFTIQITNYDNNFTYGGTATANGSVAVSESGLVTVTGVAANTSIVATITATRAGHVSGRATTNAISLTAALVPTFGAPNPTEDGFTVQITNHDNLFTYNGTATANGSVAVSESGLVTVTGIGFNTSSVATVTTTRAGYVSGSATTTWTSNCNICSVTFASNGGSSVTDGTFMSGGAIESTPTDPTKAGYTFDGWAATNGGDAVSFSYSPGVARNITLYARWSANTYSVTYDSNGGSAVADGSFTTGGSISDEPTIPTRNGYTFMGWAFSESNNNGSLSLATFPFNPTQTSDFTLYARWATPGFDWYSINFDSINGSTIPQNGLYQYGGVAYYNKGSDNSPIWSTTGPVNPTKEGYIFEGWSFTYGGDLLSFPLNVFKPNGVTLYAKWSRVPCTYPDFCATNLPFLSNLSEWNVVNPDFNVGEVVRLNKGIYDARFDGPYATETFLRCTLRVYEAQRGRPQTGGGTYYSCTDLVNNYGLGYRLQQSDVGKYIVGYSCKYRRSSIPLGTPDCWYTASEGSVKP